MEVAATTTTSRGPFQREVREWQHVDPNTGALLTGRLEADRWVNGPLNSYGKLTFGTIVPLKDGSGTQIGQLEDEIGDALLALVRLQGQFQGGLRDGQFKSSWLVARTVNETIEMLNTVANLTQTLLQHSQFQQYRTITSAIRIVHNTSTRLVLELERALPVISAGGKFDVRARSKLTSVKETIDVSYKLIKQYFEVMITKS